MGKKKKSLKKLESYVSMFRWSDVTKTLDIKTEMRECPKHGRTEHSTCMARNSVSLAPQAPFFLPDLRATSKVIIGVSPENGIGPQ
jgi:hypothetical protein